MKYLIFVLSMAISFPAFAQRLAEDQGVELRGSIVVEAYAVGECNINEENHTEEEYERIRVNQGRPMDAYRAEFSVYNGSGRALDHLIATYRITSESPDCTNWTSGDYTGASWLGAAGQIQATETPYSVAPEETLTDTKYIIVLDGDPAPQFEDWWFTFNFANMSADTVPPAQTGPSLAGNSNPLASATTSRDTGTPPLPQGVSAADTCEGKEVGAECWMEVSNLPGCYLWNSRLQRNQTADWSGACAGGLIEGIGELRWTWEDSDGTRRSSEDSGQINEGKRRGHWVLRYDSGTVYAGPFLDGESHGDWVERYANGDFAEGPYVDGARHGDWVVRFANGRVEEGPYVDGEQHGHWVQRFANGNIAEGPYVDGARHGDWVWRYADGSVEEGPYVDGEQHGDWVWRFADGGVFEGPFVNGERHGHWVERYANGNVEEGPYADGERQGHWVERDADGGVEEGPYVNDRRHGHWVERYHWGGSTEGLYVDGRRHGQWPNHTADGTVEVLTLYANGEMVGIEFP